MMVAQLNRTGFKPQTLRDELGPSLLSCCPLSYLPCYFECDCRLMNPPPDRTAHGYIPFIPLPIVIARWGSDESGFPNPLKTTCQLLAYIALIWSGFTSVQRRCDMGGFGFANPLSLFTALVVPLLFPQGSVVLFNNVSFVVRLLHRTVLIDRKSVV